MKRQKEMRAQRLQEAQKPPNAHRRVLGAGRLLKEFSFRVLWVKLILFLVVINLVSVGLCCLLVVTYIKLVALY